MSLSLLLKSFNLQPLLLQNKRCNVVNWVMDQEDYLDLHCCQALLLSHSVGVAIWQLYSTASLSSEIGNKGRKAKDREEGRSISSLTQGITSLRIKKAPFTDNRSETEKSKKDDTGDCEMCSQLPSFLNPLPVSDSVYLCFLPPLTERLQATHSEAE